MSEMQSRVGFRDMLISTVAVLVSAGLVFLIVASTLNKSSSGGHAKRAQSVTTTGAASVSAPTTGAAHDSNENQARLVANEDGRVAVLRSAVTPARYEFSDKKTPYRIQSNDALPTLVLTPDRAEYTVADLRRLMPTTFVITPDRTALLSENIAVSPGVTLDVNSAQVSKLELASSGAGFVSIISFGGAVQLTGTAAQPLAVTSWDADSSGPDVKLDDGRAYLRAIGGQLDLTYVHAMDLGFWSGRTGGIALTGSNKATSGETDNVSSGSISDTTIDGDAFGLFATVTRALTIDGAAISNSLADGVLLHRSVTETSITDTTSNGNGGVGFLVDRGASGARLTRVTASHNAEDGIKVDGEALAVGASASGASTTTTSDNHILNGVVRDNARTGIEVVGGNDVEVSGNTITGNQEGIVVRAAAQSPTIVNNTVDNQVGFGLFVRDGVSGATISRNHIDHGTTGIFIRDSTGTVTKNVIHNADGHAISLAGATGQTKVSANTLAGRGTSALDSRRAEIAPIAGPNDVSSWKAPSFEYSVAHWVIRPIHIVWTALFALILVSTALARHQRGRRTHPYAKQARLTAEQPVIMTLAPDEVNGVRLVAKERVVVSRPARSANV